MQAADNWLWTASLVLSYEASTLAKSVIPCLFSRPELVKHHTFSLSASVQRERMMRNKLTAAEKAGDH